MLCRWAIVEIEKARSKDARLRAGESQCIEKKAKQSAEAEEDQKMKAIGR